jgi:hypothetical protein
MTMGGGGKMPTRLVDAAAEDADTSEAWAVDLLRGAEPYRAPAGRKQRVQLRLGRAGKRPRRLFLRPALVGLVMFSCGAIASSAFGRWPAWVVDAYHRVVGDAPPPAPVPASEARAHRLRRAEIPAQPAAPAVAAADPVASVRPPAPRREAPAPIRARRAAPAAAPDDAATIMEAMRALRVERNPARARQLLGRYLEQSPNGALAEEALALSLEAAVARGDGDAAALAARYLKLYPSGPFQALARQTIAGR